MEPRSVLSVDDIDLSAVEFWVWGHALSAVGNTVAFAFQDPGGRSVRKLFLMQLSGANAGVPVEVLAVPPLAQFFFPSFKR